MARLDWYIRSNLKPRHLQLLVALDELRHVGRVAEFLHISQPAVSKTLAELERGLALQLFERSPRGLTPTAYGEAMVRMARGMLRDLDTTRETLRQLQSGALGKVRVGVLPVAAPVLVPQAVIRFRQHAPRNGISLQEGTADRLLPLLRAGELDLVVGTMPSASMAAGLQQRVLHGGEWVQAACAPGHPLAARADLTADDLAPHALVLPPLGSIFRDLAETWMERLAMPLPAGLIESGSVTASIAIVRDTDAIGIFSGHLARHYEGLGVLHCLALPVASPTVAIGISWPLHAQHGNATQLMIDCLAEVGRDLFGKPGGDAPA